MKIAYIAHPISGDEHENIKRILEIVNKINFEEPDTVPFVPYLADVLALDDQDQPQRLRGLRNGSHVFMNTTIDELRVCHENISKGMLAEINLAKKLGIKVVNYYL